MPTILDVLHERLYFHLVLVYSSVHPLFYFIKKQRKVIYALGLPHKRRDMSRIGFRLYVFFSYKIEFRIVRFAGLFYLFVFRFNSLDNFLSNIA